MTENIKKIIIVDIDGCLNDYPKTWINYVNDHNLTNYKTLKQVKDNLSYNQYKFHKKNYRRSQYKHCADVKEGMKAFINNHKDDYYIHIITARHNNPEMIINTIDWLRAHRIHYDYIRFVDKAHKHLIFYTAENTALAIDDNLEILNIAYDKNIKKLFIEHDDNKRNKYEYNNITVIHSDDEMKEFKIN